jgi:predicted transcriptional regulator
MWLAMPSQDTQMILRDVDWKILSTLSDGKRNVSINIALELDASPSYINNRMPYLLDYGLVEKIGPSEKSGLYQISPRGKAALELQDQYERGPEFEQLVEERSTDHHD